MAILTFQDAMELLQNYCGGTSFARNLSDLKQAVRMALANLYRERSWTYYRSTWQFTSLDDSSSASIAYTHAGGKFCTLASGSWPDRFRASQRGSILADSIIGEVDRFTTTLAYMDATLNWGQALAASTSYTLFQDNFTLPEGFRNVNVTVRSDTGTLLRYVPPEQFVYRRSATGDTGEPIVYTFMADPKLPGRYAIFMYPAPSSLLGYRIQFQRAYRELRLQGDETASTAGTVTVASGSRYGTGSGSSLSASLHEGAVMRFGTATLAPTGLNGTNPFTEEHTIADVANATTFELRSTVGQAFTAVKYVISDPIDIPPDLHDAFLKRCRLEVALMRPDSKKNEVPLAMEAYEESLSTAKAADGKDHSIRVTGGVPYGYDLSEISTGADVD